jgi:hypothetical protein
MQYNTKSPHTEYHMLHKITYNTQGNPLYAKLHTLHTIKTQKPVEPKLDESVLKTTQYTEQWTILYSTQFHMFHEDQDFTLPRYP